MHISQGDVPGLAQDRGSVMPVGWMDNNNNVLRAYYVPGTHYSKCFTFSNLFNLQNYISASQWKCTLTISIIQMGRLD